jgi:hypothetical protein
LRVLAYSLPTGQTRRGRLERGEEVSYLHHTTNVSIFIQGIFEEIPEKTREG